ncbi:hypothetical protein TNCV_2281951 [Trichonephila clavipes]|nr:hypothetical protein TNCV_2281951 [Trichonephila clavipes]
MCANGFSYQILMPIETRHVEELMHAKSVEAQSLHVDVVWKPGQAFLADSNSTKEACKPDLVVIVLAVRIGNFVHQYAPITLPASRWS